VPYVQVSQDPRVPYVQVSQYPCVYQAMLSPCVYTRLCSPRVCILVGMPPWVYPRWVCLPGCTPPYMPPSRVYTVYTASLYTQPGVQPGTPVDGAGVNNTSRRGVEGGRVIP